MSTESKCNRSIVWHVSLTICIYACTQAFLMAEIERKWWSFLCYHFFIYVYHRFLSMCEFYGKLYTDLIFKSVFLLIKHLCNVYYCWWCLLNIIKSQFEWFFIVRIRSLFSSAFHFIMLLLLLLYYREFYSILRESNSVKQIKKLLYN